MTENIFICTYLLEKIYKSIYFNVRNACMKYKFDNYIYAYQFESKLNIFCLFFVKLL